MTSPAIATHRRICGYGRAPRSRPPTSGRCCPGLTGPPLKWLARSLLPSKDYPMPKVLISDKLSPAAVDIFRNRGIDVELKPGLSPDELRAISGEYDGLAIRSATKVTKELLDAAMRLRVVERAGIDVDNVDIRSETTRGVIVMNTPHGNTITTAEHA